MGTVTAMLSVFLFLASQHATVQLLALAAATQQHFPRHDKNTELRR